ncbi:NACHT domain-containing NTPase [Vibrio splendidus]
MAFEEKVVLEAMKPASGFINALIGPKVEKLKKWAEKRELKNQLDPDALSETLNNYLNTLSSRVSVISSICFPQKEFAIERAYEPLFVEEFQSRLESKLSVEHIVKNIEESCLIIDGAGMGKSTFSKFLITQILYKSDRIPILFELRKSKIDIDLIESVAKELDPLGKVFSRELFYELIKEGKFVIVLDGFDEVEYERQAEIAEQINDISIKGQRNSLILTTRPQELVPDILNSKSYQFSNFTLEQAKHLIARLDDISGLDIGSRLASELEHVPENFLENPLLVSLLYSTFGANNTIADRICTFYNDIYHALYKGHDLINKNGFQREKISGLDYEQFRVLLRALCFQMTLRRKASFSSLGEAFDYINNAALLSKVEPKSANSFLNDLLNAVPLMQKEGSDFKFLHKTIIEYFAAEYIVYRPDSESVLTRMFNSNSFRSFEKTFDFVYELSSATYDNVVTKYYADKVASEVDLISRNKSIIATASYICDLKVGVFPVESYKEKLKSKAKLDEDGIKPNFELMLERGNRYMSYSWVTISIGEVDYFVVMFASDKGKTIHQIGWKQITTEYIEDEEALDVSRDEELIDVIGLENLFDVESNIDQLVQIDTVASMASRYLAGAFIGSRLEDRVLSSSKIQLFLDSIKAQSDMEDELAGLLDM